MEIVNTKLLANPVNWIIVVLMLLIGGYALHFVAPNIFPTHS